MSAHDKFDKIEAEMNRKFDAVFKKIRDLNEHLIAHALSDGNEAEVDDEKVDMSKEDWVAE